MTRTRQGVLDAALPTVSKRDRAVAASCAVVVLFLLITAVTALYVGQRTEATRMRQTADIVAHKDARLSALTERLTATDVELERARRQLDSAQGQNNDMAEQKKIVATCLRLTFDFLTAVSSGDQTVKVKASDILNQMRTPCGQAEPYIND